jgi:hypothetical protein
VRPPVHIYVASVMPETSFPRGDEGVNPMSPPISPDGGRSLSPLWRIYVSKVMPCSKCVISDKSERGGGGEGTLASLPAGVEACQQSSKRRL